MNRRNTFGQAYSLTFVCMIAGMLTFGVALLTNGFLLSTQTTATSGQADRSSLELESDSSEQQIASERVSQADDDSNQGSGSDSGSIMPSTLRIPRLSVDTDVEHVGYTDDGRMDAPVEWENVAWFQYGFFPGAKGNSVLAGHLDSDTGPAIFANLHEMQPGDEIFVTGEDGEELTFVVTEVESVLAEEAPLDRIFGDSSERNLNLITCEGHFDPTVEDYDNRLIVYTTLADS